MFFNFRIGDIFIAEATDPLSKEGILPLLACSDTYEIDGSTSTWVPL